MRLRELIDIIHRLAPPDLAENWDNSGLQAGSPDQEITSVGLALDATPQTVEAAVAIGCDLLLTHHPLIFKPLKSIDTDSETGAVLKTALSAGLAIVAVHTNWDSAAGGVAAALADLLELTDREPLEPAVREFYKLVVFVPVGYEARLRRALFEAGAGAVGDYDRCWFETSGEGGFRTPEDGRPFIGEVGGETRTRESRLEVVVPPALVDRAVRAVRLHHPYQEPAFEFHPVKIPGRSQGPGLVGSWNPPRDLLAELTGTVGLSAFKWAGPRPDRVSRVALLPGSGGGYLPLARRRGAQALLTGDVSYHQALTAEGLGVTVVDLGHYETEWPGVERLARALTAELDRRRAGVVCRVLPQARAWHYAVSREIG